MPCLLQELDRTAVLPAPPDHTMHQTGPRGCWARRSQPTASSKYTIRSFGAWMKNLLVPRPPTLGSWDWGHFKCRPHYGSPPIGTRWAPADGRITGVRHPEFDHDQKAAWRRMHASCQAFKSVGFHIHQLRALPKRSVVHWVVCPGHTRCWVPHSRVICSPGLLQAQPRGAGSSRSSWRQRRAARSACA